MIYAATPFEPSIHCDTGAGEPGPLLRWRFPEPARAVASGMLGGGLSTASWVINAQVRADYGRMDPEKHLREIALEQGLDPDAGVGLMTAARVERVATAIDGPDGAEVRCDATVGVSYPTWASAPDDDPLPDKPWRPGTINIVCQLPVPLTDAALVGAVITATEAKAQALIEAGMPGTGTASDAIVICCPQIIGGAREGSRGGAREGASELIGVIPFAGPRSIWGARLARAVHSAVIHGLQNYRTQ